MELDRPGHVEPQQLASDGARAIDTEAVQEGARDVDGGDAGDGDDDSGGEPVDDELVHGQFEDVEAEVVVELRVIDAERLRVLKQQDAVPVAGSAGAKGDGDKHGDESERGADEARYVP